MCRVCHQQQTDVPGRAPLQEGAEVSQRLYMRMNNLMVWPLLEQLALLKADPEAHNPAARRQGADITLLW